MSDNKRPPSFKQKNQVPKTAPSNRRNAPGAVSPTASSPAASRSSSVSVLHRSSRSTRNEVQTPGPSESTNVTAKPGRERIPSSTSNVSASTNKSHNQQAHPIPPQRKTTPAADVKSLAPKDVKTLASEDGKSVAPKDGKSVAPKDVKSVAPKDVKSVAPKDVKSLAPEDAKSLAPENTKSLDPEESKAFDTNEETEMESASVRLGNLGQQMLQEMAVVEKTLDAFGSLLLTEIEIVAENTNKNDAQGSGRLKTVPPTVPDASNLTVQEENGPSKRVIQQGSRAYPQINLVTNPDMRDRLNNVENTLQALQVEMAKRDKRDAEVYKNLSETIDEVKKGAAVLRKHLEEDKKITSLQNQIKNLSKIVWDMKCEAKAQMHFGVMDTTK